MPETPSYLKVNYAIRPAKNIERKMIAEALARLSVFCRVKSYRYIGMGSTFYSDFTLFHRILGMAPMVSIQKRFGDEPRFDFNLPLGCIKNEFGHSNQVLPGFQWRGVPTVVWLDYDDVFEPYMLEDIGYLASVIHPSSVLIVTVRSRGNDFGEQPEQRVDRLKEIFKEKLPIDITQADVVNEEFHKVIRRTLNATLNDVLIKRNSGISEEEQIEIKQIFYFLYADTTPMMTIGGLFIKKGQCDSFSRCDFESLDFCMFEDDPYEIYAPNLTYREQRYLDKQLPAENLELAGVPQQDLAAYARLYRYFPHFVEAEL